MGKSYKRENSLILKIIVVRDLLIKKLAHNLRHFLYYMPNARWRKKSMTLTQTSQCSKEKSAFFRCFSSPKKLLIINSAYAAKQFELPKHVQRSVYLCGLYFVSDKRINPATGEMDHYYRSRSVMRRRARTRLMLAADFLPELTTDEVATFRRGLSYLLEQSGELPGQQHLFDMNPMKQMSETSV